MQPKREAINIATATPLVPTPRTESVRVNIGQNSSIKYLVREQLANRNLPNDAIGVSTNISGFLSLNTDGSVGAESIISIDMSTFESDSARRDQYLRRQTLETDRYPTAQYEILGVEDLEWPLPNNENISFQIVGNMTLHGITQPLKWDILASHLNGQMTGTANTEFSFDDFDLEIPNLFFILDVDNNIRLELVFDTTVDSNS